MATQVAELKIDWVLVDDHAENAPHLSYSAAGANTSASEADDLFDTAVAWLTDHYLEHVSDENYVTKLSLVDALSTPAAWGYERFFSPTDLPGNISGPRLPNACAAKTRFASGMTGRRKRGGAYNTGLVIAQLDTDENYITSAVAGDFDDAWEAFATGFAAGTPAADHVIWSRAAHAAYDITSYATDTKLRIIKRRMQA